MQGPLGDIGRHALDYQTKTSQAIQVDMDRQGPSESGWVILVEMTNRDYMGDKGRHIYFKEWLGDIGGHGDH